MISKTSHIKYIISKTSHTEAKSYQIRVKSNTSYQTRLIECVHTCRSGNRLTLRRRVSRCGWRYSSRRRGGWGGVADVISIWRLYLPGVEPGISRWLVGIPTARPWREVPLTTVKSRVRFPGDEISRLRLHQWLRRVTVYWATEHTWYPWKRCPQRSIFSMFDRA